MPSTTEAPEGRALGGEPPAGEAEEEDFEEEELDLLRATLLSSSPKPALHYQLAALQVEVEGGGTQSCSVIGVAELEGQLLVAVPHNAWHRQAVRRSALTRTTHTEVLAADPTDRAKAHAHFKCRVWLGLLDRQMESNLLEGGEDEAADRGFVITGSARGILPYEPSLASAARDLFSFASAGEGPPQATAEEAPLDSRVKGIEDAVLGLEVDSKLCERRFSTATLVAPPMPRTLLGLREAQAKGAIPGLDAAVLASARAAGIPEEQLVKMGELASRAGKLEDGARTKASILSESEEEDVPEAGGAEESSPGNVSEAICKMTATLSQLARSRKPGSLEDLLDRGESAEAGSSGGSSKAAAYQKLSTLLRDDPGKIASSVLKLMSEDFSSHRSAPGLDGVTMTARGWLEHRSRVQQYMGPVRWGWQTAGALDSLLALFGSLSGVLHLATRRGNQGALGLCLCPIPGCTSPAGGGGTATYRGSLL